MSTKSKQLKLGGGDKSKLSATGKRNKSIDVKETEKNPNNTIATNKDTSRDLSNPTKSKLTKEGSVGSDGKNTTHDTTKNKSEILI